MKYVVIFFCIVDKSFGISRCWFNDYQSALDYVNYSKEADRDVNCQNDCIYEIISFPELEKFL